MRITVLSLCAALLASCVSAPSDIGAASWSRDLDGKAILFVGAHPDDEVGLAPLLASACIDGSARCHFVVAAEGKSVGCLLARTNTDPVDCSRVRREEMRRSARLFNGDVEFYGWEDLFYAHNDVGLQRTLNEWADAAGGRAVLVARFEQTLRTFRPQVVLSLDPRHGSTCHPAHRATATLLLEALGRFPIADRPQLWFEQSDNIAERSSAVAAINEHFGYVEWPETLRDSVYFDANKKLRNGRSAYDYVGDVLRIHASQWPKIATGEERADAPASQRLVPLAPISSYASDDYCTKLSLSRPTFDIPGNKERLGLR